MPRPRSTGLVASVVLPTVSLRPHPFQRKFSALRQGLRRCRTFYRPQVLEPSGKLDAGQPKVLEEKDEEDQSLGDVERAPEERAKAIQSPQQPARTHSGLGRRIPSSHSAGVNQLNPSGLKAQEQTLPLPPMSHIQPLNPLISLVEQAERVWGNTPLHHRLQKSLLWWKKWALPSVVTLLQEGIKPQWVSAPHLSKVGRQGENLLQARQILLEYEAVGAVKRVSSEGTQHLLPWFLISKPEEGGGTKWRFISDCRELNNHFQVEKFRLEHLQNIFPLLQKGHWAAKIDLKDAYFHIPVSQEIKSFLRHKVGDQVWEYQAGPFGLNIMPQIFQKVMATFEKKWRAKGVQVYIYLDDILVLAPTAQQLQKALKLAVTDLISAGFKINLKKSCLQPSQIITHLGFILNFQEAKLQISQQKLKSVKKELGKFLLKNTMSKRQLAAILGKIRANLLALPFLRAFTTLLVSFLAATGSSSWDSKHFLPQSVKEEMQQVKRVLDTWSGRPFLVKPTRTLHSDSSDRAWGGLDISSGDLVQEFWRNKSSLHINYKEMAAAINTVRSLAKKNENVLLCVDNQVLFYYLQKGGGRKNPFNQMLQPFFHWLMAKNITLQVKWVPSAQCLADPISRWSQDPGDYTLDCNLFRYVQKIFAPFIHLETDLFASPGNKKLRQFVARWPHWEAKAVDALQCSLDNLGGMWANPPWSVIQKFLARLRLFPSARVLLAVPFWASAPWWPLLTKLRAPGAPVLEIKPFHGMFTNCWGEKMPPPGGA